MGRVKQQDVDGLIPISVSVELLDEQYPHLRNLVWNSRDDEDEVKPKKREKNGI